MLIFYTLPFVLFLLHILSYFYWLYNGSLDYVFFGSLIKYPYSDQIIKETYAFNFMIFLSYLLGLFLAKLLYKKKKNKTITMPSLSLSLSLKERLFSRILLFFLYSYIIINFSTFFSSWGNYANINKIKESYNFIFEFRVLINIFFLYIILNHIKLSMHLKILTLFYFFSICVLQARSIIFEFLFIIAIPFLITKKINLKIFLFLCITPFIPNLIVAFRFVNTYSITEIINYLFSFEYLTLFNLIVSEAILKYSDMHEFLLGSSYSNSIALVIPSFIRDIFDISVDSNIEIDAVRYSAGVHGGGFSLIGELFMNFGYYSVIFVFLYSIIMNSFLYRIVWKYSSYMKISLIECIVPLILIMTILSLRNDTSPLIKYTIQLLLISGFIMLLINYCRFYSRKV
ncbi:hypothetical protein GKR56_05025 [Providencia alcalifaciens]|uniref:Wzy n=1 Tax=Providencia alcalifaciens TaxID=126385 RepID=A0A346CLB9_9GAMM|nr:O-antigen polymerase [Providencia alcalifaciens]AXL96393.1 hypothetical protein [Providencia alcalifaciens]MTC52613.1 hypothetical protein [Providencia alcalifaciens]